MIATSEQQVASRLVRMLLLDSIRFHSEDHNYSDLNKPIRDQGDKGIKIGNNCWIGAGAVFLDGAELGN